MRHIKKFNETFEMDAKTMNVVDVDKNKISPEELKNKLNDILDIENFEECTKQLVNLKDKCPYVRTEEPFKSIYWNAVKKWRDKLKKTDQYPFPPL